MTIQHRSDNHSLAVNCWYHEQNVIIDDIAFSFLNNAILSSARFQSEIFVLDHCRYHISIMTGRVNNEFSSITYALRMMVNCVNQKTVGEFSNFFHLSFYE